MVLSSVRESSAHIRGSSSPSAVSLPLFQTPPRVKSDSKFFLWLTDAHIDLFYDSAQQDCRKNTSAWPMGMMGCDPPLALMQSTGRAAAAAAASVGGAEFTLFTGDFVRHGQHELPDPAGNVTNTIRAVSHVLAGIGTRQSMGALGNNDSPRGYELEITEDSDHNPWLFNVGEAMEGEGVMSPRVFTNYSYGGFFEEERGGLLLLTLNTIIYSVKHIPAPAPNQSLPVDPFGQLAWLRQRLEHAAAQGRPVWIVGHIPPGIETYGYTELWHSIYLKAYLDVVQAPGLSGAIACQLFGHVPADEFRLLPGARAGTGPILLAGAISPIWRSNPAFRMVEYDPATGRPLNYLVYYSAGFGKAEGKEDASPEQLLDWRLGYSAVESYTPLRQGIAQQGSLQSEAFWALERDLEEAGVQWNRYAGWYKVQYANDLMYCGTHAQVGNESMVVRRACVSAYTCALRVSTIEEYDACRHAHARAPRIPSTTAAPSSEAVADNYELARQASWEALRQADKQE